MEDTHWEMKKKQGLAKVVLILVLMEDTHWDVGSSATEESSKVLILVLMEDTHWDKEKQVSPLWR